MQNNNFFEASKRSNNIKKLHQRTHIHFRNIITFEFVEMTVVAHNIFRTCGNGTIHEFVVVRIGRDKIELKKWGYPFNIRCIIYRFQNKISKIPVAC